MKKFLPKCKQLVKSNWLPLFFLAAILSSFSASSQSLCGQPSFPAPAEILSNVSEASGYNLVYHLPIPLTDQGWNTQAQIPYSENNTAALSSTPYTRVAYYM